MKSALRGEEVSASLFQIPRDFIKAVGSQSGKSLGARRKLINFWKPSPWFVGLFVCL